MEISLLHTPDGVRDIYNEECEKKIILEKKLSETMESYGYHIMQTPMFEFFDVFGKEIGTTPSRDLFKFFDHEGNTLVLRPDITPSIARAAAKYFYEETMPIKLYYNGNSFINNDSYKGRLKEVTQIGCELINDNSVSADAEMIVLAISALKASGLKDFQISIGHANFFQGLVDAVGLDRETTEELRDLLGNKNFFRVEEVISKLSISDDAREMFSLLGGFHANVDEIRRVKVKALGSQTITDAIKRILDLDDLLKIYGVDKYVSYEFGNVSAHEYYTGVIFSAYTYGSGEPVISGGRYDRLIKHFGKDAPAIGFAIVVDTLMTALFRQNIDIPFERECELVCFDKDNEKAAILYGEKQRTDGKNIELMPMVYGKDHDSYEAYAKKNYCNKVTFMEG
ncbi:MAG: ATP phosphoribosyltransferase regulatory subunit [Lachnospiraceae bacterium]|nr:ATP phosphoribosyltransferase regulatory subunit [Lachnospiraceae bacterium]